MAQTLKPLEGKVAETSLVATAGELTLESDVAFLSANARSRTLKPLIETLFQAPPDDAGPVEPDPEWTMTPSYER